jgi:hypothetical protein
MDVPGGASGGDDVRQEVWMKIMQEKRISCMRVIILSFIFYHE